MLLQAQVDDTRVELSAVVVHHIVRLFKSFTPLTAAIARRQERQSTTKLSLDNATADTGGKSNTVVQTAITNVAFVCPVRHAGNSAVAATLSHRTVCSLFMLTLR